MGERDDIRHWTGAQAYWADPPGSPGLVSTTRAAVRRTLAQDPTAPTDTVVAAASRALASAGIKASPARTRMLVEKLMAR